MNFKNKIFGVVVLAMAGGLLILETGFSGAQTPVVAQADGAYLSVQPTATISRFNAAGYEATPMSKPVHSQWKLSIPHKGTANVTPTLTMVPIGTVAPTPALH